MFTIVYLKLYPISGMAFQPLSVPVGEFEGMAR